MAKAAAASVFSLKEWLRPTTNRLSIMPSPLLLDGGVSTHLEQKSPFAHRELWSSSLLLTSDGRDTIRECHVDFLSAGADIVSTVTYQAHYMPISGKEHDSQSTLRLEDSVVDKMLQDGVQLAKEAVEQHRLQTGRSAYVAASIGSLGGSLADGSEYTGNFGLTIEQIACFHRRKMRVLAAECPDVIAFETIPCIVECVAILTVLKEVADDPNTLLPPVWMSLACSDGEHLNDGSNLLDALSKIDGMDPEAGLIQAIGINCCSCNNVKPLLEKLVEHMLQSGRSSSRAIVFYPNSGEGWDAKNEKWVEGTGITEPTDFAEEIMASVRSIQTKFNQLSSRNVEAPPIIVGGCCRTTPETIAAIRSRIDGVEAL